MFHLLFPIGLAERRNMDVECGVTDDPLATNVGIGYSHLHK